MGRDWDRASRVRRVTQLLLDGALRLFWGLRVEGVEHIPADGPLIVAGNHNANLDGPMLAVAGAYGGRCAMPLTKQEAYRVPVVGAFLRAVGTIELDRRGDIQAMRAALGHLAEGGTLLIFPEGTRSKTGVPGPAKAGLGFLASRSGAAVLPARLRATRRWPFTRSLRVTFGPPLRCEDRKAGREACLAFSQAVLDRILALP